MCLHWVEPASDFNFVLHYLIVFGLCFKWYTLYYLPYRNCQHFILKVFNGVLKCTRF